MLPSIALVGLNVNLNIQARFAVFALNRKVLNGKAQLRVAWHNCNNNNWRKKKTHAQIVSQSGNVGYLIVALEQMQTDWLSNSDLDWSPERSFEFGQKFG